MPVKAAKTCDVRADYAGTAKYPTNYIDMIANA